jgi:cytochrome c oxidase subunit 2
MFVKKLRNCLLGFASLLLLVWAGAVSAEWTLNMTRGVTPVSNEVYELHMLILWIVTIIGIGVFCVMFWSIYHHRKSKGAVPAQFHHSTVAELTWTIIPILILVGMAVPATKTLIKMEQTGDAEITVKITGYQWRWQYEYKNEGISFYSSLAEDSNKASQRGSNIDPRTADHYLLNVDKPLVLPVNKKIRLITTGKDVIHSWWVPALGWKRDAIPGFINDNWVLIEKPGIYRGQCAELCGMRHGFMPIVLKAVPEEEYLAWVEENKKSQAEAAK